MRILTQPAEVGATIDHALAHLKDDARATLRVVQRLRPVLRRGREAVLDAARHAILVWAEELLGQRGAAEAAVDAARGAEL